MEDWIARAINSANNHIQITKLVEPWIVQDLNAERQEQDVWLASIDPTFRAVWCAMMRRSVDELLSIPVY